MTDTGFAPFFKKVQTFPRIPVSFKKGFNIMKILIFSDLHRNVTPLLSVLRRRRGLDDLCVFLGDGCDDFEDAVSDFGLPTVNVAGNGESCFGLSRFPEEELLNLDGKRILMLHGHRVGVKSGLGGAVKYAAGRGADILLFGHTHEPCEEYIDDAGLGRPMWLFNPGSIGAPPDGEYSFGTLEIKDGIVLFGHGKYSAES